jgi:hypothetical protein
MEFCLHYDGKLKSNDNAKGKHEIRKHFHNQIHSLCASKQFKNIFEPDHEGKRSKDETPMFTEIGGKRFWFLVTEDLATVVDLKITILLPHPIGQIVKNGGDIDNRIKTLFDALRVPAVESEIPSSDDFDYSQAGMYCLLQDDKLINRVSIQSYQDHDPKEKDYVKCFIEVQTKITRALWGNLNYV